MFTKKLQVSLISCIILFALISCKKNILLEEKPNVYIEKDKGKYHLIRNGKPFIIKGAAGDPEYLPEFKEAGGNTFRVYDTLGLQEVLDKAATLNIAVVVDIPLPVWHEGSEYYTRLEPLEKLKFSAFINRYKDHPALLYWNLGNEIHYPNFYEPVEFFSVYNELLETIQDLDPNHPVSTAIIAGERKKLISILLRSPKLDFISFNAFGTLTRLNATFKPLTPFWDGPFVISEWGVNGPWEEKLTSWEAPIEPTGTKKIDILLDRSRSKVLKRNGHIGSFVFYWGNKYERTGTWFSIFSEDGSKATTYYALKNMWTGSTSGSPAPSINYASIDGYGAPSNLIFPPGELKTVEVLYHEPVPETTEFKWSLTSESWSDILTKPAPIAVQFQNSTATGTSFYTPTKEGAYRLYLEVKDEKGSFNSTNIPFYVLNPDNEN